MASTYSTNLAIELIGTGDQAGTWGVTTNTNLGTLIEQAISGYVTQAVATGTDTTITIPNGATGVARNMYIELTGTGGASTNLVVPANKKLYFIFNNSTGAVTVKVAGQTGVSVPAGAKVILVSNGTDIVNATDYIRGDSANITVLTSSSATITNLLGTTLSFGSASLSNADILSATITSATITGAGITSAAITTVTGTTLGYGSASLSNLKAVSAVITSASVTGLGVTSAAITTLTGTTVNYTSGTVTNLNSTSANITTLTGTTASYGSASLTNLNVSASATLARFSAGSSAVSNLLASGAITAVGNISTSGNLSASGSITASSGVITQFNSTSATITTLKATSATLDNVSFTSIVLTNATVTSANITTLTGTTVSYGSGSLTGLNAVSANIATLTGTTLGYASASITTVTGATIGTTASATIRGVSGVIGQFNATSATITTLTGTSSTITTIASTSATITTLTGTTVGYGSASLTNMKAVSAVITSATVTGMGVTSAAITTLTGTTLGYGSASLTNMKAVSAVITSATVTGVSITSAAIGKFTAGSSAISNLFASGTIITSGNIGVGVTPSAWSGTAKALQVANVGVEGRTDNASYATLSANGYTDSGTWKYISSDFASRYTQFQGQHLWFIAPSGTAGNTISFTEAMKLNEKGQLTVTATSANTAEVNVFANAQTSGQITLAQGFSSATDNIGFLYNRANAAFVFGTNNLERARITSGGDFGIGTTSPGAKLDVQGNIILSASNATITFNSGGPTIICPTANTLAFTTSGTERARITSGGNLLVGTTSAGAGIGFDTRLAVDAGAEEGSIIKTSAGVSAYCARLWNSATTGDNLFMWFGTEAGGTTRGTITYNRGAGQVAYNVTSDARLKENIADAEEAGDKIDAMQVRQFDWKETGNHLDYGFVAQELHNVAPHAVSKPEDEEAMWSVDYSKLVPMLIKEVQSLRKRVAELEAK